MTTPRINDIAEPANDNINRNDLPEPVVKQMDDDKDVVDPRGRQERHRGVKLYRTGHRQQKIQVIRRPYVIITRIYLR